MENDKIDALRDKAEEIRNIRTKIKNKPKKIKPELSLWEKLTQPALKYRTEPRVAKRPHKKSIFSLSLHAIGFMLLAYGLYGAITQHIYAGYRVVSSYTGTDAFLVAGFYALMSSSVFCLIKMDNKTYMARQKRKLVISILLASGFILLFNATSDKF